jgi:hypothetical protein
LEGVDGMAEGRSGEGGFHQEEWVARPSGGHRQAPRHEPRNPWIEKIRQMTEHVGTWLMMISTPQAEPSQGAERMRTR